MANVYSTTLKPKSPRKPRTKAPAPITNNIQQQHKGAHSELLASCWLISRGYLVFRNLSPHGVYDLVVYDEDKNEFIGIDVKTAAYYLKKSGSKALHYPKGRKEGVPLVLVDPDGVVFWEKDKHKMAMDLNFEVTN